MILIISGCINIPLSYSIKSSDDRIFGLWKLVNDQDSSQQIIWVQEQYAKSAYYNVIDFNFLGELKSAKEGSKIYFTSIVNVDTFNFISIRVRDVNSNSKKEYETFKIRFKSSNEIVLNAINWDALANKANISISNIDSPEKLQKIVHDNIFISEIFEADLVYKRFQFEEEKNVILLGRDPVRDYIKKNKPEIKLDSSITIKTLYEISTSSEYQNYLTELPLKSLYKQDKIGRFFAEREIGQKGYNLKSLKAKIQEFKQTFKEDIRFLDTLSGNHIDISDFNGEFNCEFENDLFINLIMVGKLLEPGSIDNLKEDFKKLIRMAPIMARQLSLRDLGFKFLFNENKTGIFSSNFGEEIKFIWDYKKDKEVICLLLLGSEFDLIPSVPLVIEKINEGLYAGYSCVLYDTAEECIPFFLIRKIR